MVSFFYCKKAVPGDSEVYFLDIKGRIMYKQEGVLGIEALRQRIQALLDEIE